MADFSFKKAEAETSASNPSPVEQSLSTLVELSVNESQKIIASDKGAVEKVAALADLATTVKAFEDDSLQSKLVSDKKVMLTNASAAAKQESQQKITQSKGAKEQSLYDRYEYIYKLFGIKSKIPAWFCIIILCLYAIFGSAYAVLVGVPFLLVNLLIDSISGLVGKIAGLTKDLAKVIKYSAIIIAVILVLGAVGVGLYYLIKLIGVL